AGAVPRDPERGGSGIAEVRIAPVRTARAADHEPGLWSTAPDERVHHHLSRVQSLLGHEGVGTGELMGGRLSSDRRRLVPWGTEPLSQRGSRGGGVPFRSRGGPWPGRLPGATPSAVFAEPRPAALLDCDGAAVGIDAEHLFDAEPARFGIGGKLLASPVHGWSAPWPLRERWWVSQSEGAALRYRVQILLEDGDAWLLRYEEPTGWSAEAHYA
ncbi:MAG: DNA polymerase Y family protein, partial [Actinobacteria bacterium]|nr:DNA polymerase Y family protein [Actinomycetota bacterium]